MKWSELSHPWQICIEQAWLAFCSGSVPVGAAVVSHDGQILAVGRNRIHETSANPRQVCDTSLAHAELNALLAYRRPEPDPRTNALYTTLEPCPLCMGAMYMSGVRRLYFAARDAYAGSTDMIGATPYLSVKAYQITGPWSAVVENLMLAWHTIYMRSTRVVIPPEMLTPWLARCPHGVDLGESLFASGELTARRSEAVDTVFEDLTARLEVTLQPAINSVPE